MTAHLGEKLDGYLDGSLSDQDQKQVQEHLRGCPACTQELKELKRLAGRLKEARPAPVKGGFGKFWDRLLGRHKEVKIMTVIQRLKRVVESNIHSAIDSMEEPSKMIRQLLREMEEALSQAREEVVESLAQAKGGEHRWREALASVKKWEDRAQLALKNGREDLAREALREQMSLEALAEDLKLEWEKQAARATELKDAYRKLERQLDDLRRRKSLWLVQAQNVLRRSHSRSSYETAYGELARMLGAVQEKSWAEAASSELDSVEKLGETLDEMDRNTLLEQRLASLKQRLQQ